MFRKLITLAALAMCLTMTAFAQMSDQQVLQYVQQGMASGKAQDDIITELALRGVTKAQAERVKALYEKQKKSSAKSDAGVSSDSRLHSVNGRVDTRDNARRDSLYYMQTQYNRNLANQYNQSGQYYQGEQDTDMYAQPMMEPYMYYGEDKQVFGRDIFRNKNLDFAPSENLATPRNYRLGPGDEVIIEIYGANQTTLRNTISPEGSINVDVLGPIYLNGMTVEEANAYLKKRLASIYGGLNRSGEGTDIVLSLGQVRAIQINVLGDVLHPGTYTLSSFSTVFHALYVAGGIVDPGSLRNIIVSRDGKTVATTDVYEFLINGSRANDIRLEEGDVILVTPYECMVEVQGSVKRPMFFELKKGDTVKDLIAYAGGYANSAYRESVTIVRQNGKNFEVKTVSADEFGTFELQDGDQMTVGKMSSRFENRLAVYGAVYLPGLYELGDEIRTVRQLVAKAGGVLPEAFLNRAVILREHADRSKEILSINLGKVLSGEDADLQLMNNDELHVSNEFELTDQATMTIGGMVANPGVYPFAKNTTIEDFIILAGGLRNGASLSRVDVSRRMMDANGLAAGNNISEHFSFTITDGLLSGKDRGFTLEPYDEVIVHRSPSYNEQRHFTVEGEVNFAGEYAMSTRDERISDLVAKAGGVTEFAYVKGARLYRQMNDSELAQIEDNIETLMASGDSTSVAMVERATEYSVAIYLDKALANPGSDYDIVLREGDRLEVPVYSNTVRISGAVMTQNTVAYVKGQNAKDYIMQCGGFAERAKKNHAYIINMNGDAERYRPWKNLSPGAEIIVPKKGERKGDVLSSVLSVSTTAASLGTMAATIGNLIK